MANIKIDPQISNDSLPFIHQTLHLLGPDGTTPLAWARWAASQSPHGVAQLLQIETVADERRKNYATVLLREVYRQVDAYFRARGQRPRRLWLVLEQKSQVVARAFVTRHGFHHTSTINNLLKHEDAMVYSRSFD